MGWWGESKAAAQRADAVSGGLEVGEGLEVGWAGIKQGGGLEVGKGRGCVGGCVGGCTGGSVSGWVRGWVVRGCEREKVSKLFNLYYNSRPN